LFALRYRRIQRTHGDDRAQGRATPGRDGTGAAARTATLVITPNRISAILPPTLGKRGHGSEPDVAGQYTLPEVLGIAPRVNARLQVQGGQIVTPRHPIIPPPGQTAVPGAEIKR